VVGGNLLLLLPGIPLLLLLGLLLLDILLLGIGVVLVGLRKRQ
jgi:hypothetical protein